MRGWRSTTRGTDDTVIVQLLPVQDLRPHDEIADGCWCKPTVERMAGPGAWLAIVVIHKSADGREIVERHDVQ